jgi:adenylate cyclase
VDEAVELLRKARAANPRIYVFHLHLIAALGLKGDLEEARAALAEAIKLKPEINSLARWRAYRPDLNNAPYRVLAEKTVDAGLRKAGMPEE